MSAVNIQRPPRKRDRMHVLCAGGVLVAQLIVVDEAHYPVTSSSAGLSGIQKVDGKLRTLTLREHLQGTPLFPYPQVCRACSG